MFLEGITDLLTPAEIRAALQTLPKGLDETYDFTMKRILGQRGDIAKLASLAIAWILHAERLLTVLELRCILSFERSSFRKKQFSEDDLIGEDVILSACAGLVTFVSLEGKLIAEFVRKFQVFLNVHI